MKKFLSVFLALVMVVSSVAFAIPSAVTVYDAADGTFASDDVAELSGVGYKVQRGINMLTGSKAALTGENWSTYGGIFNSAYGDNTFSVASNPDDEDDKVIKWNIPGNCDTSDRAGDYVNFRLQFGPNNAPLSTYISHPYMYVSYDIKKEVVDESGYTAGDSAWIMNTTVSNSKEAFYSFNSTLTPTSGWMTVDGIMNLTLSEQKEGVYTSTADPTQIIVLHTYVDNANTSDVNFYLDNMFFAPAYKVTYYNKTGTKVVYEDYVCDDGSRNLLTSFKPQGVLAGGVTYSGWSLTAGGTPVESISLTESNNADIVLYATEELDAFEGAYIELSGKLTEIEKKVTAKAALSGDPDMLVDYIRWTSSNSSVVAVEKNKDGTATLTAKSEGTATVTYTYSHGGIFKTLTKLVTVATGPIINPVTSDVGVDTDMYEYVTVNVSNPAETEGSIRISYTTDITTKTQRITVPVPAGVENMDICVDMSGEEAWVGILDKFTVGKTPKTEVEINNKKLWAEISTDVRLEFTNDMNFIGLPGVAFDIGAFVDCDLEGVYDTTYTLSYEDKDNCVTVVENKDGSLSITAGENKEGYVVITATSNEDENVKITRTIYVKTGEIPEGEEKLIGYKWDFNNASATGFTFTGHHNQSKFTGTSAVLIETTVVPGQAGTTASTNYDYGRVLLSPTTFNGKSAYKLTPNGGGSMYPSGNVKPKNLSMEKYPYLCLKVRADEPALYSMKVYLNTTQGESHSEGQTVTASNQVGDEYTYIVFDVSKIAAAHPGYFYNDMMLVNSTHSVIDTATIKSSGSSYYVESPVTYSKYRGIEIDEMFFANYNPLELEETPLLIGVKLESSSNTIVGENTITLKSTVYASEKILNYGVKYSADNDIVTISLNEDGTALVTPIENGTVTIRAESMVDPTAYDEVTITISGVQKKLVAYDLRMVSLGNSYLCHGYAEWFNKDAYNGWINADDTIRGMAASEPDLDYYGRIQYYVKNHFNCSLVAERFANNHIERAWMSGLKDSNDTSNHKDFDYVKAKNAILDSMKAQCAYIKKNQTNIITIQLYENAQFGNYGEIAEFFYDTVFGAIDEVRPEGSVVVVITPINTSAAANAEILKAQEYGYYVANMTDISNYGYKENPYLAFLQYPDFYNPNAANDFRSHPGDLGMDEIGKRVFAQLKGAIPVTIPANYIYIPKSIEITGGNAITTENGTLKLGISATPSENSTTNVVWSVDNENIATIDADGVLTAVNNGKVTVTAVCAYDDAVKTTLEVTVSGQPEAYTITYNAGTSDTVTRLPEADIYAKGTYTLSEAIPERAGYKFTGWSENAGGNAVKTVEMTGDKTVYATWKFADHWYFDNEGDLEGISLGGFHTYCRYEANAGKVVATVTSYGDGVSVFDSTLLINSDDYDKFVIKLQPTAATASDKLNLTLTNDSGKTFEYSVPMTSTAMKEYTFDISNAEGIITGFALKPTVIELTLYIDEMYFSPVNHGSFDIDLGAKENAGNTRYAEIDGVKVDIAEENNKFSYTYGKNSVVKVVEKSGESVVSERYFYVKASAKTATELEKLENYLDEIDSQDYRKPDFRTNNKPGMRFKAEITTASKNERNSFAIEEYGFIFALERTLSSNNEELTFNSVSKYVSGAAYVRDNFDKVFDSSKDGIHMFAGTLYGIPETEYDTNIVARAYAKIKVCGEEYVLYGDAMLASLGELISK